MLDISPSYLHLCAPADTAFLPNELTPLHQPQHASARLHHLFRPVCNFCHLLSCHYGGQVENTSHRFMARVKLNK